MHAGSLQIQRLTSSGGTYTVARAHPLGNINQFHRVLPDPEVLNLTRHEIAVSRIMHGADRQEDLAALTAAGFGINTAPSGTTPASRKRHQQSGAAFAGAPK